MSRFRVSDLLLGGRELRTAGRGIWSVLPAETAGQKYDHRAAAYDFVVGSALYNRLVWGTSTAAYGRPNTASKSRGSRATPRPALRSISSSSISPNVGCEGCGVRASSRVVAVVVGGVCFMTRKTIRGQAL